MGKVNKKALFISLALTIVCALVLLQYMRSLQVPVAESPKTSILVSVRDIRVGEMIADEDVRSMAISSDSVPEGILSDRTAIVGKYAKQAVLFGEPFRSQRLGEKEELNLSYSLEEGYRAVSVFVNESNLLSMQLMPGNRVDVLSSRTLVTKEGDDVQLTNIVLQNVEVLSLGPNRAPGDKDGLPNRGTFNVEDMPKTVTLAVTPEEAEVLAFSAAYSNFTFALRGDGDDTLVETDGAVVIDTIPARLLEFAVEPGESSGSSGASGSTPSAPTTESP